MTRSPSPPIRVVLAAAAIGSWAWTTAADPNGARYETPDPAGVLFMEREAATARVSILFLPDDLPEATPNAASPDRRLIVTGAYSSGDRFGPEGFSLRRGEATHPWPQGWDGLLLVDAAGDADLHDVSRVALGGAIYNLREREERRAFLQRAEAARLSAIQSHLLIRDGALDLRPLEDAPRFRRRMLFQMADGRIGVYDTSPRSVTLYEAAGELLDAVGPEMAINLDMGAYDFCELGVGENVERCGLLGRDGIDKLTNVIMLSRP